MNLSAKNITVAGRITDVSAMLERGKITAICGPNGAGKSTLLLCLGGLIAPDNGRAELGGVPLSDMVPIARARQIGFLPQNGEAAWDVAVRNLVALGRMPHGDAAREPVDAAIAALDLEALQDRPISQLSGGEKARALLARVLAGEPDWILADEPLAALDLAHQLALIGHFRREAESGAGVVIVLHDLALAMNHADTVILVNDGSVYASGSPEDALNPDNIHACFGVTGTWIGKAGKRAFVC